MKVNELISKIVDSVDTDDNEVFEAKGKTFQFEYGDVEGDIWVSIYQELDNAELPDIKSIVFQSAQVKLTAFDKEGNELHEIECENIDLKIADIEEKVMSEFYQWNN